MPRKILRKLGYGALALLGIVMLLIALNYNRIDRLLRVNSLFDEENIVNNFLHLEDYFPYNSLTKSVSPYQFPKGNMELPASIAYRNKTMSTSDYLEETRTTGLLILHRDSIQHESYYNGHTETTTHISWSVAKSFVSAMVGIALEEGLFESIEEPITKYVPELTGSGYDGVRIKDILQMSSGVRFNEDYVDFNSDINRFGRSFALGSSLDDFCKSLVREKEPGTFNHYVSIDTQVLGMLLKRITGKTLTAYLQEKIWDPLGMEHDAQWAIDNDGMEMALGGLNVTLRDYAKFGYLYLKNGKYNEQQLVPANWVQHSITPDAPHLMPGANPNSANKLEFGYGYQWWIPPNGDGAFMARGIYNQYIYIYPKMDLVIVKNSANHRFGRMGDFSMQQTLGFFEAVVDQLIVEELEEERIEL